MPSLRLFLGTAGGQVDGGAQCRRSATARIADICAARGIHMCMRYGHTGAHYRIRKITPTLEGLALQVEIMGTPQHFMLNMVGAFQAMNALAALGLYVGCGGEAEQGMKHLPHLVTACREGWKK